MEIILDRFNCTYFPDEIVSGKLDFSTLKRIDDIEKVHISLIGAINIQFNK